MLLQEPITKMPKMLDEIVKYIYNKLPSNSWGSRQIVNNWLNGNEDN